MKTFNIMTQNRDLDLSVEWFQLLFRKIKLTSMNMKAIVRALARFSDCHFTRFRPIASVHFEM